MLTALIKNLKHLVRSDLRSKFVTHDQLNKILDQLKYEVIEDQSSLKMPKIKSVTETLDDLIAIRPSICRFGDGELELLSGNDIAFQESSIKISDRLKEVLISKDQNIFIAIPKAIFSPTKDIKSVVKDYWRLHGLKYRQIIHPYLDLKQQYYSAEITIAYLAYENYNLETYFHKLQKLWQHRDIAIICGKTIFDKININIFDCAKSIQYIYGESKNAFEHYDYLLEKAQEIDKSKIVVIILGPTATILTYDLAKLGYQALDLGHIAKSYDWYMTSKNTKDKDNFFRPD